MLYKLHRFQPDHIVIFLLSTVTRDIKREGQVLPNNLTLGISYLFRFLIFLLTPSLITATIVWKKTESQRRKMFLAIESRAVLLMWAFSAVFDIRVIYKAYHRSYDRIKTAYDRSKLFSPVILIGRNLNIFTFLPLCLDNNKL